MCSSCLLYNFNVSISLASLHSSLLFSAKPLNKSIDISSPNKSRNGLPKLAWNYLDCLKIFIFRHIFWFFFSKKLTNVCTYMFNESTCLIYVIECTLIILTKAQKAYLRFEIGNTWFDIRNVLNSRTEI